jgi:hypothetical protein
MRVSISQRDNGPRTEKHTEIAPRTSEQLLDIGVAALLLAHDDLDRRWVEMSWGVGFGVVLLESRGKKLRKAGRSFASTLAEREIVHPKLIFHRHQSSFSPSTNPTVNSCNVFNGVPNSERQRLFSFSVYELHKLWIFISSRQLSERGSSTLINHSACVASKLRPSPEGLLASPRLVGRLNGD